MTACAGFTASGARRHLSRSWISQPSAHWSAMGAGLSKARAAAALATDPWTRGA